MIVVDSSGWLEYFSSGPNASIFEPVIEDSGSLVVPTICLFEVRKRMGHLYGPIAARDATSAMLQGIHVPLTPALAIYASKVAELHKLPLADSIILATAQTTESVLWTQDAHFEGLPGVKYFKK